MTLKELEKQAIAEALTEHRWNMTVTAFFLGIGRATLYRKIKRYNLRRTL